MDFVIVSQVRDVSMVSIQHVISVLQRCTHTGATTVGEIVAQPSYDKTPPRRGASRRDPRPQADAGGRQRGEKHSGRPS